MRTTVLLGMLVAISATAPASAAGTSEEHRLLVNGVERWTMTYVPSGLRPGASVVLLLHGGGGSMRKVFARNAGGSAHWLRLADREGFLLLVPNATNAKTGDARGDKQNWNDLRPASAKGKTSADDVGFLMQLLDWARQKYRHDPRRVYVTGASNGGMMTFRLLLERPKRFAAAAAFIASLPAAAPSMPAPGPRVPLMLFNGTKDPLVQWLGGTIRGDRGETMAIEPMVEWWREVNGVNRASARTETLPDTDPKDGCRIHGTRWSAEPPGAPLMFYRADGGGHALPSIEHSLRKGPLLRRLIGPVCRDAEGAELAWEFFKANGG